MNLFKSLIYGILLWIILSIVNYILIFILKLDIVLFNFITIFFLFILLIVLTLFYLKNEKNKTETFIKISLIWLFIFILFNIFLGILWVKNVNILEYLLAIENNIQHILILLVPLITWKIYEKKYYKDNNDISIN
jgi:hypothetical protein